MIGIDKDEVIEYQLVDEKGKENATTFLIGNISNKDKARLFMGAISSKGEVDFDKIRDNCIEIIKAGLRGMKSVYDTKSKQRIDVTVINDNAVELIPFEYLIELMGAIVDHNFLTRTEEKN